MLPVPDMHPWSPEDPYLYDLYLRLGDDEVESYFAMRKFSVESDGEGVPRLFLNGAPYFHNALLDQGYWSDGLLTAPSDEALVYDIELAKSMGFNALRKHIKLEPLRWYYHCDRLGMLVWQDMPNGGTAYRAPAVTWAARHRRAREGRPLRLPRQKRPRKPRAVPRGAARDAQRARQLPLHRHVGPLQRGLGSV